MDNWQMWAVASAVFAALVAILGKAGVASVDPDVATLTRVVVILVFVAVLVLSRGVGPSIASIPMPSLGLLALSGLATSASWLCYTRALKLGPASQVAPVDKLSVVTAAVFAAVFLGERLSVIGWAGVALVGAGAVLIAWKG